MCRVRAVAVRCVPLLSVSPELWLVCSYLIHCNPSRCHFGLAMFGCNRIFEGQLADVRRMAYPMRAVVRELDLMVHGFKLFHNLL